MKLPILLLLIAFGAIFAEQPEGFENVDLEEFYSNIIIQDLVNFGAQHVINAGMDNGNLPDADYFITQVYSIGRQELKDQDRVKYAFDVMLMDHDGTAIRSNYILSYSPSNQTQEVLSYAYDEEYYAPELEGQESDSDESDDELPFDEDLTETSINVDRSAEWLGDVWFTEDELVDDRGLIVTGAPTSVSIEKFNADPEIQDLFLYGLEDVLEQITPQEIAISQFHVTDIFEVKKQVVNGINYIFDAEVENSQGVTIRTKFEVYSQSWTGVVEVLSYSYVLTDADGSIHSGEESFIDY